ncbi:MAG: hypothetical protein LBL54_04595, partial [Clostridiales Family XIII bacterium]|nr:hypothetical protein [Clostridiales Family XIII bacterium]
YTYSPLDVDDGSSDSYTIHAKGYDEYYDGNPRYITYSAIGLTGVLSFWYDPSGKGLPLSQSLGDHSVSSDGIWEEGIPPGEVNVTAEEVDLIFTADGKNPTDVITRSAIIRPRPLVPAATHAEMTVGDDIPFRASYGLTMGYDGKKADGTDIGDNFKFADHESEFDKSAPQITTTYKQGDPEGDYPIYVKAGVYGNYEIYEGTTGNWPFFEGWRFAGTMHVKAASTENPPADDGGNTPTPPPADDGGNTPDDNNVDDYDDSDIDDADEDNAPGEDGVAKTGDNAHPELWMTTLILSFAAFTILLSHARRRRLQ